MGFFSWKTQDTDRSICNQYSCREPFRVIMTDDKGNKWIEDNYDGYGRFGGKDYYELVDEMNGGTGDRLVGIDREFKTEQYPNTIFPSLSEDGRYYDGKPAESCDVQGFFYYDEESEEEWDEDVRDYDTSLDDDTDLASDWDEGDIDPAGGHGPASHV